jgi:PIN domain nuclease of toxin-antitoxin system
VAGDVIVLDTHALLWWALDPEKLSSRATEVLATMEREGGFASAISIWELGIKVKRGKLVLPLAIDELSRRIERSGVVELLPVDATVWIRSLNLEWAHPDQADRVIVATALIKGLPLLTKDEVIRTFAGVRSIW